MAKKNTPNKRDPLMRGLTPLPFDNVSESELLELKPKDRASLFLSTFDETFNPHVTYAKYFANSPKERNHILAEIKTYYIHFVENGNWTERKYAKALVKIFETGLPMSPISFDRVGEQLDRRAGVTKKRGRL